jgi:hypothetical protein
MGDVGAAPSDGSAEYDAAVRASLPFLGLLATAVIVTTSGCVKRTIRITSDPTGALVYLNDREVGRTPVDVDFVHYGTYDVRLTLEGHESQLTSGDAKSPWWDFVGIDFFAELVPADLESNVEWHFVLDPRPADPEVERVQTIDRAREMRAFLGPAPEPVEGETPDDTEPKDEREAAVIELPGGFR